MLKLFPTINKEYPNRGAVQRAHWDGTRLYFHKNSIRAAPPEELVLSTNAILVSICPAQGESLFDWYLIQSNYNTGAILIKVLFWVTGNGYSGLRFDQYQTAAVYTTPTYQSHNTGADQYQDAISARVGLYQSHHVPS